jgi:hypothetical protein
MRGDARRKLFDDGQRLRGDQLLRGTIAKDTVNGYQNSQNLPPPTQGGSVSSIVNNVQQGVSGIQGISFPTATATSNAVTATPVVLGR